MKRALGALAGLAFAVLAVSAPAASARAQLDPIAFSDMHGWSADDHGGALAAFRTGCRANVRGGEMRLDSPIRVDLGPACRAANALPALPDRRSARLFFERFFTPARVRPPEGEAFFTGYFEPVVAGSLTPTRRFSMPLLARPDDVVDISRPRAKGALAGLTAARRRDDGRLVPLPDRAAIEGGALAERNLELVWLDPVDAFFVHVQGSTRVRLADGKLARFAFAGRNGHPFTAIGRVLVERGAFTRDEASMERIRAWLAANPRAAPALMHENRSYIFFRRDSRAANQEAVGGAGFPLTPGRSIAIDRRIWPYNLPVWVSAELPLSGEGARDSFERLMVMQDTGAAIIGPARGDLFLGSGPQIGNVAGRIRHNGSFIVLLPKPAEK